jgi:hypothetical protein
MSDELQRLIDRQAIVDCLHRYARGVDRMDEQLVLSAFHPDATIDRGVQVGTPAEFVAAFWAAQEGREACQHHLANMTVELDGDVAHAETYYAAFVKTAGSDDATLVLGRYVDRFERRDGAWAIAVRYVTRAGQLVGRSGGEGDPLGALQRHLAGARNRSDLSYERPLRAPSER